MAQMKKSHSSPSPVHKFRLGAGNLDSYHESEDLSNGSVELVLKKVEETEYDNPDSKLIYVREQDKDKSILDADHPTDPKEGDEVYTAWIEDIDTHVVDTLNVLEDGANAALGVLMPDL